MGYVIITKPHFSSREGINHHCGHFDWLVFDVLAGHDSGRRYDRIVASPTDLWRSTMTALISVAGSFK